MQVYEPVTESRHRGRGRVRHGTANGHLCILGYKRAVLWSAFAPTIYHTGELSEFESFSNYTEHFVRPGTKNFGLEESVSGLGDEIRYFS